MVKLVCTKCNNNWYTANTAWSGNCESCSGELIEEDLLYENKEAEIFNILHTEREIASSKIDKLNIF